MYHLLPAVANKLQFSLEMIDWKKGVDGVKGFPFE